MRRKEKLAEEERMSKLRALLGDWRNDKKDGDDKDKDEDEDKDSDDKKDD